jgi:dephospho-CoA kinase
VTVTEVPLLYEVGAQDRFDKVVVITAPAKLREARARVPTAGRSDRLLAEAEKVKRGDYVYVNTGTLEALDSWIAALMEELRASRAPAPT